MYRYSSMIICWLLFLTGCSQDPKTILAPVSAIPDLQLDIKQYYTVLPGDTLSEIALRYRISQEDLMQLNELSSPERIRVGQLLAIPNKRKSIHTPEYVPSDWMLKQRAIQEKWRFPITVSPVVFREKEEMLYVSSNSTMAVYSIAPGTVTYVGKLSRHLGSVIVIRHDDDLLSIYGHLQSIRVKPHDRVNQTTLLGHSESEQNRFWVCFRLKHQNKSINPAHIFSLS